MNLKENNIPTSQNRKTDEGRIDVEINIEGVDQEILNNYLDQNQQVSITETTEIRRSSRPRKEINYKATNEGRISTTETRNDLKSVVDEIEEIPPADNEETQPIQENNNIKEKWVKMCLNAP